MHFYLKKNFMKDRLLNNLEHVIVLIIWVMVFSFPIIMTSSDNSIDWTNIYKLWNRLIPFFLLFLFNHYLLVPYFLIRRKLVSYLGLALLAVILLGTHHYILRTFIPRFPDGIERPEGISERFGEQPNGFEDRRPPEFRERPIRTNDNQKPFPKPRLINMALNISVMGLLLVGFDSGLRLALKWNQAEKERALLEKENTQNQLAFLKHQVSPHFFMNTLNNIHALIDINHEEAKESIIKLSKLMRYLLYESDSSKVNLAKEMEFIQSYVNLMRLRFSDKVAITLELPERIPDKNIPPLLFISLIENAFKHGISYQDESFIHIRIMTSESKLIFEMSNSIANAAKLPEEESGIGIENTRKRLDLLFGKNYLFEINHNKQQFNVNLVIPV